MGVLFSVTCRNKECRYRIEIREGAGMVLSKKAYNYERDILSGKEKASDEIISLLKAGHKIHFVATYLCPTCREWQTGYYPYIFEPVVTSPNGTIRDYKVHFLNGEPKCEKCGTKLVFLLNPRSSKNCCPKCEEANMTTKFMGWYD